jgi:hypothetical protein
LGGVVALFQQMTGALETLTINRTQVIFNSEISLILIGWQHCYISIFYSGM